MKKRLTLTRETLTELAPSDLVNVVAGVEDYSKKIGQTCPLLACVTNRDECGNITYNC